MINIFPINCSLAFAPYLLESLSSFMDEGREVSRVVRQGGSGLIIRSEGEMTLRYRNRETALEGTPGRPLRSTGERTVRSPVRPVALETRPLRRRARHLARRTEAGPRPPARALMGCHCGRRISVYGSSDRGRIGDLRGSPSEYPALDRRCQGSDLRIAAVCAANDRQT